MTAFARRETQTPLGKLTLEIRSVNNRYLDLGMRLGDVLKPLEPAIREHIGARVRRGRVEFSARLDAADSAGEGARLNRAALESLDRLQSQVRAVLPKSRRLSVAEVLAWPGVIDREDPDDDSLGGVVLPLLDRLLDEFVEARGREGSKLADLIGQRIDTARQRVEGLKEKSAEIQQAVRERLQTRLAEVLERLDTDRVEQEVVLLLNKSDVDEEIDRLLIHFDEVLSVLRQNQPVGRKLDFLMQELNREANTLGSKAAHPDVTNTSVDLKVLIEQMREQVQNIE
jgi:uncharacterized protein (TIGR00255 family)